jgi:tetratricopeptide (TPR) repeat protein
LSRTVVIQGFRGVRFLFVLSRSVCYYELKKYDKALADAATSITLAESPKAFLNRGMVYLKLGKPDEASKDFSKAISLDDQLADAYEARSEAYAKLGQLELAAKDKKKLEALHKSN